MMSRHKIVGNEAWDYAAHRLSPAHGSMRMFAGRQYRWRGYFAWVKWWHFAVLIVSALLMADRFI